ncbi:MAG: RidA family protein [Rhodospirillaceae bacterium]
MPRQSIGPVGQLPDGATNPISPAVRAGDFVFISGLMPKGPDGQIAPGGITAQTKIVMERLRTVLETVDCSFEDVVKCTVWITDAKNFKAFNSLYESYFLGAPPARSAVRCDLLLEGALLELEALCYKPVLTD